MYCVYVYDQTLDLVAFTAIAASGHGWTAVMDLDELSAVADAVMADYLKGGERPFRFADLQQVVMSVTGRDPRPASSA